MSLPTQCLYIVEDYPITPAGTGGASVLFYNHLEMLHAAGCTIHLLMLADPRRPQGFQVFTTEQPAVWQQVLGWCASHQTLAIHRSPRPSRRWHLLRILHDPVTYVETAVNPHTLTELRAIIDRHQPDFIWAESHLPATLAVRTAVRVPIIYAHLDWLWRVRLLRGEPVTWRTRFDSWLMRRADQQMIRAVTHCVSPSASEAAEMSAFGARTVTHLPMTYQPVDVPAMSGPLPPARIVHLGGMKTTANRVGLQRFMTVAWPQITAALDPPPELWIIGSLDGAPPSLLAALREARATCTGFVQDLRTVLRPYDVHIIPWEHNTGTRTRIPLVLSHAQVLVASRASRASLPQLQDGVNCLLVTDLDQMSGVILDLLADPTRREQIGWAGQGAFLEHFTRQALQPRFDSLLQTVLSTSP